MPREKQPNPSGFGGSWHNESSSQYFCKVKSADSLQWQGRHGLLLLWLRFGIGSLFRYRWFTATCLMGHITPDHPELRTSVGEMIRWPQSGIFHAAYKTPFNAYASGPTSPHPPHPIHQPATIRHHVSILLRNIPISSEDGILCDLKPVR